MKYLTKNSQLLNLKKVILFSRFDANVKMMHFKKNLLAEYKKHDSDETSTSSPPSSPTLSSSSSTALDRDDSKDSVSSGLQARYRVESVSSQPHLVRLD